MTTKKQEQPKIFKLHDRVSVVTDGSWLGEKGRVCIISDSLTTPYGVVFDWDVTSMPVYFEANELELV